MTQTNIGGRPRVFDEDPLVQRINGFEDLALIEAALVEHSSHPTWARGCVDWLWRRKTDPTGGRSRPQATRYRQMLAELDFDPLKPPGGRRRALRAINQNGIAHLQLLAGGSSAGLVALAALTPSVSLRLVLLCAAPIMPEPREIESTAEIRPVLRLVGQPSPPESTLDAHCRAPWARIECVPDEEAA